MQSRSFRQPQYAADKAKARFTPRSRLRLQIRRLFGLDTLPGPGSAHLRRARCIPRPSYALCGLLLFLLSVLFMIRPLPSQYSSNFADLVRPHELFNSSHPDYVPVRLDDSQINITTDDILSKIGDDSAGNITDGDHVDKVHSDVHQHSEDKTMNHDQQVVAKHDDPSGASDDASDHPTSQTQKNDDDGVDGDVGHPETDLSSRENITRASLHLSHPNSDDNVREKYAVGKMSIVVLFHNEYDSLNTAVKSWVNNRLIDYVDEVLFFLNGVRSESKFRSRIPDYDQKIPEGKRRIVLSKENLPLGLAITRMVELAQHEYVLLLEKDWELIENEEVVRSRLTDSKVLIGSGTAHVVRHRHRHDPGVPLHALIMHQGREESIFRQQPNLLCYCHHWMSDPTATFPGAGYMRRCGGPEYHIEEVDVYCASSVYCNWSNNPAVFYKKWFMDEVGDRYRKEYGIEKSKYGSSSPFLDFEYYTNWRGYAWADKNFTVALGTGLFRHAESEHRHFNTFWYAHFRLTVDLEEIRNLYLKNETKFKALGGVHYDPNYSKPPTLMERYPVSFVRKFHWEPMFTGNLSVQLETINSLYSEYQRTYRVSADEWDGKGDAPAKASKAVDWRTQITRLHNAVEKAMMLVPPVQPHEMNITLVTTVLDIGRDGLAEDEYKFKRHFDMYLHAMQDWLKHKYKKVVYTSKDIADELMKTASDEVKASTKFVYTSKDELSSKWLGPDNFAKVQEIRTSESWRARASWLTNSPQGALEYYNPLVMSKMFMMRDAARANYWNTTHFLFIDSKHSCRKPDLMTPLNDHIIRAHMFEKFLMTTFDYTPSTEVHGFAYEHFNQYCNQDNPKDQKLVRVGRGGIFGGSAFVLEYMTAMYDIALTASLREGLMGTEENIFSILLYNVRQYVDEFSNNWACPDNVEKDHTCRNIEHQGYNCAIFDWAARNAVPWKD